MSHPRLASRLQAQAHDPVLASDVGPLSVTSAPLADDGFWQRLFLDGDGLIVRE